MIGRHDVVVQVQGLLGRGPSFRAEPFEVRRGEQKAAEAEDCRLVFFSSRRRHTRCSRDWSSDVCSSDLKGSPTVILARTIKGYGLGEAGEGKNVTHQQKKLNEDELREFRSRFGIPLNDEDCIEVPFYRPAEDSIEIQYLRARREALGGYVPKRSIRAKPLLADHDELFNEFLEGSEGREVSITMAFVGMLRKMLKDPEIGKLVVPIVPDEARTFGMESLFRTVGIYSSVGQKYEPVDVNTLLYYKEAKDGQILEEGITEAGSIASFIAAGSAYATHGINTIPFFIYYSMFGFQRSEER